MCAEATGSVEGASIGSTWNPSGVPCFFPAALGRPVERQAVPPPEGVSAALRTPGSWSLLRLTGAELEDWSIYQKRLPPLMIFIVSFVNKECFYVAWLLHRFVTYQVLWDTSPLPPPPERWLLWGCFKFSLLSLGRGSDDIRWARAPKTNLFPPFIAKLGELPERCVVNFAS